jgi:hypothetical protein
MAKGLKITYEWAHTKIDIGQYWKFEWLNAIDNAQRFEQLCYICVHMHPRCPHDQCHFELNTDLIEELQIKYPEKGILW